MFENYVADIEVDGKQVELALWDTAGKKMSIGLPFYYQKVLVDDLIILNCCFYFCIYFKYLSNYD